MIKVSHEVPTSMLEESRSFNDYDYALVHLFEDNPNYFNFYKTSIEMGRDVLLDNSIFELREAFSFERFSYWIEKLHPTRYIIPDVMHDKARTIDNVTRWLREYKNLPGKTIGVVQGTTYSELAQCYNVIANTCDEISINLAKQYYPIIDSTRTEEWNFMIGRQMFIEKLLKDDMIDKSKRHHLLGAMLPQEFEFYKDMDFIYSLDTSNPIVHGLLGISYGKDGLQEKEKTLLADLIDAKPNRKQKKIIMRNVKQFKKMMR